MQLRPKRLRVLPVASQSKSKSKVNFICVGRKFWPLEPFQIYNMGGNGKLILMLQFFALWAGVNVTLAMKGWTSKYAPSFVSQLLTINYVHGIPSPALLQFLWLGTVQACWWLSNRAESLLPFMIISTVEPRTIIIQGDGKNKWWMWENY
jgi:hypothetical protein